MPAYGIVYTVVMRRAVLGRYARKPTLVEEPIPDLKPNHNLIRMSYAPLNPADLSFVFGTYGIKRQLPTSVGFEGSGIILKAEDPKMVDKKVSVLVPSHSQIGTYATHVMAHIQDTVVWGDDADLKQISCSMINPLTVLGFKHLLWQSRHRNVLMSAANSQLSRMCIRYFSRRGIQINGIVRNESQVEGLLELGASKVFVEKNLGEGLGKMEPMVFFDAVGGELCSQVVSLLPPGSKTVVYGNLSKKPAATIKTSDLLFSHKSIEGFWLNQFLEQGTPEEFESLKQEIVSNTQDFEVKIRREYGLDQIDEAIHEALRGGAEGKVVLRL